MSHTIKKNKMKKREKFSCGPGGMDCVCCFPAPGSKERRYLIKANRRNEERQDFRCQEE
jgi:hypothetical protein